MRRAILACGGLALVQSVWAGPSVSVAALSRDFHYTEYAEDGRVLDRESGILPGVGYGLGYRAPGVEVGLDVARYAALLDYEGQTQSDVPHSTQSDAVMWDVGVTLRLQIIPDRHQVTVGMSDSSWERDILPAAGVLGLYEFYRWRTTRLGYAFRYQHGAHQVQAGIEHLRQFNSAMEINFAGIDATSIRLKNGTGWRSGLHYAFNAGRQWSFTAQYQLQAWSAPRSDTVLIDSAYGQLQIYEPRSETVTRDLSLGFSYRF